MGREVRRVPADWQHPKRQVPDYRTGRMVERYEPLFPGENYQRSVDEWDEECAKWKAGWRPDYCTDQESRAMTYEQYSGQRPHRDDYMPDWPAEQRTHLMDVRGHQRGNSDQPGIRNARRAGAVASRQRSERFWQRHRDIRAVAARGPRRLGAERRVHARDWPRERRASALTFELTGGPRRTVQMTGCRGRPVERMVRPLAEANRQGELDTWNLKRLTAT